MSGDIGIGIIGCGGAALDVCEAIDGIAGAKVAATFDRNEAAARDLATPRGATLHTSLAALLADPDVDIAYIGLPHVLLGPTTREALRAGRHVLAEKPMALDDAEIRDLAALAAERRLTLGVNFELREAATIRMARQLITEGAIGEVRAIRLRTIIDKPQSYWTSGPKGRVASNWRASKAEAGGGVVLMNSIHQLDAMRFITGLSVTRASGSIATLFAKVEVEDTGSATLALSNGGILSLVAAAHSPGARHEESLSFDGEFGRLDVPDAFGSAIRLFLNRPWQHFAVGEWIDIPVEPRDMHIGMLSGFIEAVRQHTPPPATATDAAAALATVLAIYDSSRSGQAVAVRQA